MSITVIIECTSSEPIGGFQEQRVYTTDTVGSLIENYCAYKGVRRDVSYALMSRDCLLRESIKTVAEAGLKDGDHLFLVKQGGPSQLGLNYWWIFAAAALSIGIIGLTTITILFISAAYPPDFGILFDAGSSHTSMYLYNWKGDKENGTGVVRQLYSCAADGGIANKFAKDPVKVKPYLEDCLNQGIARIPSDRQSSSPVYLAATAGMRILSLENPESEEQILGNVSELFETYPLKRMAKAVRTICGDEEALSGWVSVNYLSDTLTQARRTLRTKREVFTPKTIGALDLGGASTQITYEVPQPDSADIDISECGNGTKVLKLYGNNYYLYSRSFLCYGVNELRNRYRVLLLKNFQPGMVVPSPCDTVNFTVNVTSKDLTSRCSNTSYLSNFTATPITFNGIGNLTDCQQYLERLLNKEDCEKIFQSEYCFEKPPPRSYNVAFSAFSSFGFISTGLNFTADLGRAGFYNKSKTVCTSTWSEVQKNHYPGILPQYVDSLCFASQYQYELLKNQYALSEEEWKMLNFSQEIDGTEVGWALGFMINATNVIPEEEPVNTLLSLTAFILLGALFASFVVLSGAAGTIAIRKSRIRGIRPLHAFRSSGGTDQRFNYGAIDA